MVCVIPSNPDVGGIGIRFSIYVQALLPLLISYVDMYLGSNAERRKSNIDAANTLVLTGMALLISSIVQQHTLGLTVYHAGLVLNLCWITVAGSLPLFVLGVIDDVTTMEQLHRKITVSLFSLKLSIMGGFGVWLYQNITTFDRLPNSCTDTTIVWFFGHRFPVTHWATSLVSLYSSIIAPGYNTGILVLLALGELPQVLADYIGRAIWKRQWRPTHPLLAVTQGITSILYWAGTILLIVSTEMTVRSNDIQSGEYNWTLGQTFAVLVALIPLRSLIERLASFFFSHKRTADGEGGRACRVPESRLGNTVFTWLARVFDWIMMILRVLFVLLFGVSRPEKITRRQKDEIIANIERFQRINKMEDIDLPSLEEIFRATRVITSALDQDIEVQSAVAYFVHVVDECLTKTSTDFSDAKWQCRRDTFKKLHDLLQPSDSFAMEEPFGKLPDPDDRLRVCQTLMSELAMMIRKATTVKLAPFTFPWTLLRQGIRRLLGLPDCSKSLSNDDEPEMSPNASEHHLDV
ncbi:hypothetical protein DL93DRAFT_279392 [Clavulina sp. PMI_390]|nr:hypothetical protein DL93DRAFT_279392 [Clavulina sp. PMI_390]